ncbi:VWA domain-containing protein, partial [Roseovarius salis]|uniref:VWA domain-containing protein n=1 Tax=Roseovarius salis TaxID=3376063 RepID=UPI0037C85F6F
SRPGHPDGRARIDVVATLRAAVPWQRLRRARRDTGQRVIIHPGDIRLRRYEDRSDRLLIFTVDASGSAAMARLAEAKGAVEMLLVQAYARRDHVAVVAFRGKGAEILLPPTRSLVQAKRRLAGMPGGGGT